MKFSWHSLPKPVTVLAPMEDVTDTVFRQIIAGLAPPDVFFTEFTSVDGLFSRGRAAVIHRFDHTAGEHPIIAQVWGTDPELFRQAAALIVSLGFDGMDINMGCPQKNVTSRGAGACLIDDRERVSKIILAAREGLSNAIPLSIKTRIGYKKVAPDWIQFLLEHHLDALIIHGRTAREQSKTPADWDEIGRAVKTRDRMKTDTVIIGNGDVTDYEDTVSKCRTYGTDGAMIGRGIFQNLWAFDKHGVSHMNDRSTLLRIMRRHIKLFEKTWGATRNFSVMKKFFTIYVQGFPNASDIRVRLMEAADAAEALRIISSISESPNLS